MLDSRFSSLQHRSAAWRKSNKLSDVLKSGTDSSSLDSFEEHARKLYRDKMPEKSPFGDGEAPLPFGELDIFTKVG
jgi:hypothetical protein